MLYDIGAVSTPEPFQRLVSQGMILGEVEFTVHKDAAGAYVAEGTPGATTIRWGTGRYGVWGGPLGSGARCTSKAGQAADRFKQRIPAGKGLPCSPQRL